MPLLRLFAAVPLTEGAGDSLGAVLKEARERSGGVKWAAPGHFHITLAFLGNQEESLLPSLSEALKGAAARISPFPITIGGLDAFPNLKHPRVLFVPVREGKAEMEALAAGVRNALKGIQAAFDEKDFHAHVTLGRVKDEGKAVKSMEALLKACPEELGEMSVRGFGLFQSRLTSEDPVHECLERFEFH